MRKNACLLFVIAIIVFTQGCSKSGSGGAPAPPPVTAPVMGSSSSGTITKTYALFTGNITSNGNTTITARGFCWAKTPNPTLANSFRVTISTSSSFTDTVPGLAYNNTYYVRAYASNSAGTTYSNEISFTTPNSIYTIGQVFQGGKIFYIDSTGDHGLIWPGLYNYPGYVWATFPHINVAIGNTSLLLGTGQTNTQNILASGNNASNTAAAVCDNYVHNGYTDWFLPSMEELVVLRQAVNVFEVVGNLYWSSSEASGFNVYHVAINATSSFSTSDKNSGWGVIPIRKF